MTDTNTDTNATYGPGTIYNYYSVAADTWLRYEKLMSTSAHELSWSQGAYAYGLEELIRCVQEALFDLINPARDGIELSLRRLHAFWRSAKIQIDDQGCTCGQLPEFSLHCELYSPYVEVDSSAADVDRSDLSDDRQERWTALLEDWPSEVPE